MSKAIRMEIFPDNPQKKVLQDTVKILNRGGVVAYPTDSGYALGCSVLNMKGIKALYQIKKPLKKYLMALLFHDLDQISEYARMDNFAFKHIRSRIPGPYTFILPAHHRIARTLGVKRPEIGCRWPNTPFLQQLLSLLDAPMLNTAAKIDDLQELHHVDQVWDVFQHSIDLLVDAGDVTIQPTNIISMVHGEIDVLRGEWS